MGNQENLESIIYPSILFRLKDDYYAIGCKNVVSIMQVPEYERLPEAPQNVIGIFKFRERVIPIICLRQLMGLPSNEEETREFNAMLDQRKHDHIAWVKELNRCLKADEPFTLATDPHKCAFGRWYYNYKPTSQNVQFLLNKLEEPHRLLHESAIKAEECSQNCDDCIRDTCLKTILGTVQNNYMPKILGLLDETKDLFMNHQYSMMIVIETGEDTFGVLVDEVFSVEDLTDIASEEQVEKLKGSKYISEIKRSQKTKRLVLMINDAKLAEISHNYKLNTEQDQLV